MRISKLIRTALVAVFSGFGGVALAGEPRLSLPLECVAGKTCFVQSYVDTDAGAGAKDFTCGFASYNGHKGTDFRLLSTLAAQRGVNVLAAAAGTIKSVRDGMPDRLVDNKNKLMVRGKECGNGVVITHDGGWTTQYCHLRKGSVTVRSGMRVERGDKLGLVGYSGLAQFAHVHIAVRHKGKIVDPFTGMSESDVCGASTIGALWTREVLNSFAYRGGRILQAGFATGRVSMAELERGRLKSNRPSRSAAALVFYARMINLRAGDIQILRLSGPMGRIRVSKMQPLERAKAHYVSFTGKKTPSGGWPRGVYKGRIEIIRKGRVFMEKTARIKF